MDYEELVQRLRDWADTHSFSAVPRAAADAIAALQARVAELTDELQIECEARQRVQADLAAARARVAELETGCDTITAAAMASCKRAERAEADLAAARALLNRTMELFTPSQWAAWHRDIAPQVVKDALAGKDAT
jgi:chromosome segregation ATPase